MFEEEENVDDYDEDVTELKFLQSKPTCFIILGKPGCGKSILAKRLSQIWRCQLLDPTQLINKEIENGTEIGKEMSEILLKGGKISTEFVVEVIKKKMESPEVAHYGYVLEGLPTLEYEQMSVKDQLKMIKSWKFNPDFIINIKILDADLKIRRRGIRVDPLSGEHYIKRTWNEADQKQRQEDNQQLEDDVDFLEEGEDEEEEENEKKPLDPYLLDFPFLEQATRERLVRAPEHFQEFSDATVDKFQQRCVAPTEKFISDHNKQNVIELDGNEAPSTLFHQLVNKLESYSIRKAVVPQRLVQGDGEEDEQPDMPDDIETDELIRTVAGYQIPAPGHRWRRSKWSRYCPVALRNGDLIQGKPEFSVSFLDKIYVLSSPEAMQDFMKNPRPYLLPPFPEIPCKIAVIGQPNAGQKNLVQELTGFYEAESVNVEEMMKDLIEAERQRQIQEAYKGFLQSVLDNLMICLRNKAKDRAKAKRKKAEERALKMARDENDTKELTEEEKLYILQRLPEEDRQEIIDAGRVSPVPEIDADDEEVKMLAMQKAIEEVGVVDLPVSAYTETLKKRCAEITARRIERDPNAPRQGGWVLDNYPKTKEQFESMKEAGLIPDQLILLQDSTPTRDTLRQNYYEQNQYEIEESYRSRVIAEKQAEIEKAKENLRNAEELGLAEEPEAAPIPEAPVDGNAGAGADGAGAAPAAAEKPLSPLEKVQKLEKDLEVIMEQRGTLPPADAAEFAQFLLKVENYDKEWASWQAIAKETCKTVKKEDISKVKNPAQRFIKLMNDLFKFNAEEFTGQDAEEEEEDMTAMDDLMEGQDADDDDDDEDEEEEDEEAAKQRKRKFGCSKHYDILELRRNEVLIPGDPEISAKYRDRIYTFTNEKNRKKFVDDPLQFVSSSAPLKPPVIRLLLLGVRGAGKTLIGRWLADKLGIFHISFREKLQEMIMPKTGRRMGAAFEEDKLLAKEMSVTVQEAVEKASAAYLATLQNQDSEQAIEQKEGDEEEENFDLTPDQLAIKNYLVEDEPLPVEVLDKIIPKFWQKEPYSTTGFILEEFPRNADECQYLQQNGFYPDLAVSLAVEEEDVVSRLLKPQLAKWKARKEHQALKKAEIAKAKAKLRSEAMTKRRAEIIAEKQKEKGDNSDEDEDIDDDEDNDEDEIEEQLADEFPEDDEEEDEDEETEEDASDRMTTELTEAFEDENGKLESVQEVLEDLKISNVQISAGRKPSIVQFYINNKLKPVIDYRASMFEKCYPVNTQYAVKMLNSGYKHHTSFGYWDPVELYHKKEVVVPPLRDTSHPSFPVVYNQFIYFLSSAANRTTFMQNPLLYTRDRPEVKPVVPMQLAVLGPPKAGKTNMSNRFTSDYGLLHVSIGKALRRTLTDQSHTVLAQEIERHLNRGQTVPDQLSMQAVANMLRDTRSTTRGYILDGCPLTKKQAEILRKFGVLPVKIFNLETVAEDSLKRAAKTREENVLEEPLFDGGKITAVRYKCMTDEIDEMEKFYKKDHDNWVNTEPGLSKWKTWDLLEKKSMMSVLLVQDYIHQTNKGEAGRLASLCITPSEFESRVGVYKQYCPVSLNDYGELVDCTNNNMEFAVEYQSKYYKCASLATMKKFLASPQDYVPPGAKVALPEDLPRKITAEELKGKFPMRLELGGYCTVTYVEGNYKYERLKEGSEDFAAEYMGLLFVFESEKRREMFMRRPDKYKGIKLPKKLPPKKLKIKVVDLPALGYLEQNISNLLIKSMNEVGCVKPKLPFLSVKKSALYYMACHLKATNPQSSEFSRQLFREKLKKLDDQRELITYLGDNMTSLFKEPPRRPKGFDEKMENFLSFANASSESFPRPLKA